MGPTNKDIAALLWDHCGTCHRPGQLAPFNLLEYADVKSHTRQLGRNLSAGAGATRSSQLIEPGTVWGAYLNKLDLRLSKGIKIGQYRLRGDLNV